MGPAPAVIARVCHAVAAPLFVALTAVAWAAPPATTNASRELPAPILDALASVRDFALNIDQPGILAVFEFVKRSSIAPGHVEPPIEVADWRDLVERPGDLRGRVIAIEGVVGRNKDPYTLASRPDLGLFGQVELRRDDQPLTCTVICTADTAAIPVNATARFVGYFVMVRNYRGASGREQQAALLVTTGPASLTPAPPPTNAGGLPQWTYLAGAILLGLVITIVLLGRSRRSAPHDVTRLRAEHEAPMNLGEALADWARREGDETPR